MERIEAELKAFGRRGLPALLLAGFVVFVVYAALFAPFDSTRDTLYNIGLIRRSLLPETRYTLETSLAIYFFEAYPIPRAEDWHRGLSFILTALWARIAGSGDTALRVPHLFWLAAWFGLIVALLRTLIRRRPSLWLLAALAGVVGLSAWTQPILRNALLDDLPGAVCVLAGLYALISFDKRPALAALLAGLFIGLACFMKDFNLHWGFTATVLIAWINWTRSQDQNNGQRARGRLGRSMGYALVFAVAFSAIVGLKTYWTWRETGGILNNPAQYWHTSSLYGQGEIDEYYPFFLYDDETYGSKLALTGDVGSLIRTLFDTSLRKTYDGVSQLLFAWVLLIPLAFFARTSRGWSRQHHLLASALALALVVYAVFFTVGIGGPQQERYWIVPVTLAVVLGASYWPQVSEALALPTEARALALFAAIFLYGQLATYERAIDTLAATPDEPYYDAATVALIDNALAANEAVLLDREGGFYYWSIHPEDRVVAFDNEQLERLDAGQIEQLFATYTVTVAANRDPDIIAFLTELGSFHAVNPDSETVVLAYRPAPNDPDVAYAFGNDVTLHAWDIEVPRLGADAGTVVEPCETITVESWWAAGNPDDADYWLNLSLLNTSEIAVARVDEPLIGAGNEWTPDQMYLDLAEITIPCNLAPGDYPLVTSIYEPEPFRPLDIRISDGTNVGSGYLTTVTVEEGD